MSKQEYLKRNLFIPYTLPQIYETKIKIKIKIHPTLQVYMRGHTSEPLRKPLGYVGDRSLSSIYGLNWVGSIAAGLGHQMLHSFFSFHLFMYCNHVLLFVSGFCCFPSLQKLYEYNYDGLICQAVFADLKFIAPPFPFQIYCVQFTAMHACVPVIVLTCINVH